MLLMVLKVSPEKRYGFTGKGVTFGILFLGCRVIENIEPKSLIHAEVVALDEELDEFEGREDLEAGEGLPGSTS